jgi:tetratricopeptide (TPR) repeat protein
MRPLNSHSEGEKCHQCTFQKLFCIESAEKRNMINIVIIVSIISIFILSTCCSASEDIQPLLNSNQESGYISRILSNIMNYIFKGETYWVETGFNLAEMGRYEEAITCYDSALYENESNSQAWLLKGEAIYSLGGYEAALTCLNRSIELSPKSAQNRCFKGNLLLTLGEYEEALDYFDKATVFSPKFASAWQGKGAALVNLGRYEEAISCFDKVIDMEPIPSGDVWREKGSALANLGRSEEAVKAYDNALLLNSSDGEAWYDKGQVLLGLDFSQEAMTAFVHAERLGYGLNPMKSIPSAIALAEVSTETLSEVKSDKGGPNLKSCISKSAAQYAYLPKTPPMKKHSSDITNQVVYVPH